MKKIEYQNRNLIASRFGDKLLLVNSETGKYFIEKNSFIANEIIGRKFKSGSNLNIEKLDNYMKKIDNYLVQKSIKDISKKVLYLEITNYCNLNCAHCYNNSSSKSEKHEMSIKSIETLIANNFLGEQANVILSGGEPLLHSNFDNTVYMLHKYNANIYVYTNGLFVTNHLKALCDCNVGIMFSLDGSDKESNDLVRGAGSFSSAINAIEKTLLSGISTKKISISFTINKHNICKIIDMLNLAEKLKVNKVFVNAVTNLGRNSDGQLSLQANELVWLWHKLYEYSRNTELLIDSDMFWKVNYIEKNISLPHDCSICNNLRISVDGDVYPCPQFSDRNILKHNINKNVEVFQIRDINQTYRLVLKRLDRLCNNCILRVFCNGGCPAKGYSEGEYSISEVECSAKTQFLTDIITNIV